jgi:hypothetical protein
MKDIIITLIIVGGIILGVFIVKDNKSNAAHEARSEPEKPKYNRNAMVSIWNKCMEAEKGLSKELINVRERYGMAANQSTAGCSPEFVAAYKNYLRAFYDLVLVRESLPTSTVDQMIMGAMNSLTRGELDGGMTRINQQFQDAINKYQLAKNEFNLSFE